MSGIAAWVSQLQWELLLELLITAAGALICITFHEVSHGHTAYILGDPTADRQGRLSLNPLKHLDLWGMVLLIFAKVRWAKPGPVKPRYFRNPRTDMALVSIAGPLSNVILSAVAAVGYAVSAFYAIYLDLAWLDWVAEFFNYVCSISAGLAVFNLLPIPPLDGSKVVFSLLPQEWYWKLMRYERYGMLLLMALVFTGALDAPLDFLRNGLIGFLFPIWNWMLELLTTLHFR